MGLTNLTELYIRNTGPGLLELLSLRCDPDHYTTNDVSEIIPAFGESPPRRSLSGRNAYVLVPDAYVRILENPWNTRQQWHGKGLPAFSVKAERGEVACWWRGGDEGFFVALRDYFGLERGAFALVPWVTLEYVGSRRLWLALRAVEDERPWPPRSRKRRWSGLDCSLQKAYGL